MQLYLVRHAESQGNATGEYGTAVSDSLSEKGHEQARALADGLADMRFDEILVSPRLRTLQTIAPYLKLTGRQGEIWPELAEACWHEDREEAACGWVPLPMTLPEELIPLFRFRDDRAIAPAGLETFGSGLRRVHDTAEMLAAEALSDKTILLVIHGHFIRELLNLLLATDSLQEFPHDNCGLTSLSYGETWSLDFCNRDVITS